MPEAIVLRGVSRRFGAVTAVCEVDLAVNESELAVVLGRSGSGKTTLLGIIGALERADQGSVLICGERLDLLSERDLDRVRRERVGWMFQTAGLLPLLSAMENASLPLLGAGVARRKAEAIAFEILETVGLGPRADHRAYELSGGEQQRVALARALVKAPSLLVADEPTGQLDSETAFAVMSLLRRAANDGTTVLVATHDEAFIEHADRVLIMDDGRMSSRVSAGV